MTNQRNQSTLADGSYWLYNYDFLGQVTSGKKYWSDGTPVAGQQFECAFDDIGNRTTVGRDSRRADYSANLLNQYSSRTVPGFVNILGEATNTATVTVNNQRAERHGGYFRLELAVPNTSPLWLAVTNLAVLNQGANPDIVASMTGNVFVAKSPEICGYDADGNMTNDGRWVFTWDAENRLKQVESSAGVPPASKRKVVWEFDGQGRRIRQTTYNGSSGSYVVTEDLKFLSDGWRHIAELNATNNALVRSYAWGLDLSGSMDGAGGVGGLLLVNSAANGPHFCAYDGNGNVVALVKTSDSTESARYEYGPFGETVRATGPMAKENSFRFSTKRTDNTTDLVLYEYRVYSPSMGRWPNRDPIGERGGMNLYGFVGNDPVRNIDLLGLTANLFPANDTIVNASSYDVTIHGDWVEIESWKSGTGTGSSFAYPWSVSEEYSIINGLAQSGAQFTVREPVGDHVLKPGHNSAADWHSGLTRIVDADFLTGAAVPVYTDSSCQRLMKHWAKPTRWTHILPIALTVNDCKCKKAVYYTHGNEYP